MSTAKEPCPLCLAAPADWVDDPHETRDALFMALAELRVAAGVGEKPMLSELPGVIGDRLHVARMVIAALVDPNLSKGRGTVFGRDLGEWQHRGRLWLLNEEPARSPSPDNTNPKAGAPEHG